MGGYNSGPYGYGGKKSKSSTSDCMAIDIRVLQRAKRLTPGEAITWSWTTKSRGKVTNSSIGIKVLTTDQLELIYTRTSNGVKTPVNDFVFLCFSGTNYGKDRAWFSCPWCSKRVALLYMSGSSFLCRHCHNLTYRSCQESGNAILMKERKMNRVLTILKNDKKSGFDAMYYNPRRPKGMHWSTWMRLKREFEDVQLGHIQALTDSMSRLGCILGR